MSAAEVGELVAAMLQSYATDTRALHVDKRFLPSRRESVAIVALCLEILYPGYYGPHRLSQEELPARLTSVLASLNQKLCEQIEYCLCYGTESLEHQQADVPCCRQRSNALAREFLSRLPEVRRKLILDAQAAIEGDPAATSLDEVILAYPGFLAITVYRLAHELHCLGIPTMPRIMSEWAHSKTGADIHPAAQIGESFFLDHATGAVIGATSVLGNNVRLYQGVTLGALSLPRDRSGQLVRTTQRHPTLQDDVTIYANATVLGGQTVVGQGSIIGGSVFLTRSIPAGHRVSLEPPRLRVLSSAARGSGPEGEFLPGDAYFEI